MLIELHEKQDLERLLEQSQIEPVLLFKHSTQCSRSAAVIEDFEEFENAHKEVPCGLILVIENRSISDDIETRFDIQHESPQAILVYKGKAVWHARHYKITKASLESALDAVLAGSRAS